MNTLKTRKLETHGSTLATALRAWHRTGITPILLLNACGLLLSSAATSAQDSGFYELPGGLTGVEVSTLGTQSTLPIAPITDWVGFLGEEDDNTQFMKYWENDYGSIYFPLKMNAESFWGGARRPQLATQPLAD